MACAVQSETALEILRYTTLTRVYNRHMCITLHYPSMYYSFLAHSYSKSLEREERKMNAEIVGVFRSYWEFNTVKAINYRLFTEAAIVVYPAKRK